MRRSLVAATVLALLVGGTAGYLLGHRGPNPLDTDADEGARTVARFRGGVVTDEDLRSALTGLGAMVKEHYQTKDGRKELVEKVAQRKIFALEARARGYDRSADVVRGYQQLLAEELAKRDFDEPETKKSIDDAELRRFYDEHPANYVHPERMRIALIFLSAPDSDAAKRASRRKEAESLLADALKRNAADYYGFSKLARERSEDLQTRLSGGEVPFMSQPELSERFGPEIAAAAFAMAKPNDVDGHLIETPKGFYLLRWLAKEPGNTVRFEDAKQAIRARLLNERRETDFKAFVAEIETRYGLRLDEDALAVGARRGGPLADIQH